MNSLTPFLVLLVYAVICQFSVVACLIKHHIPLPWLTLGVPLQLFKRCREHRARLGTAPQWWSLSTDFAVLACVVMVLVVRLESR